MNDEIMNASPAVANEQDRIRRAEQRILDAISTLVNVGSQRSASSSSSTSRATAARQIVQTMVWDSD